MFQYSNIIYSTITFMYNKPPYPCKLMYKNELQYIGTEKNLKIDLFMQQGII